MRTVEPGSMPLKVGKIGGERVILIVIGSRTATRAGLDPELMMLITRSIVSSLRHSSGDVSSRMCEQTQRDRSWVRPQFLSHLAGGEVLMDKSIGLFREPGAFTSCLSATSVLLWEGPGMSVTAKPLAPRELSTL